ncbi:MAG: hypothetical protein RLZ56_56 [Bacteroidota bacterium]|jgi:hypothetical protein
MSNHLKLYTVLSYILIPIALFFGFLDVLFLLSALTNPSALIFVFVIACLVIYTFSSFKFFRQGVQREQVLKKGLKDWVKVNAFVSVFLCSLFCLNAFSVLGSSNATLLKYIDEFIIQQPGFPKEIKAELILTMLKAVSVLFLVTGAAGLIHIRITLRLVKQYDYLFE